MKKITDGGSAFPIPPAFSPECGTFDGQVGMSLRDWFAGQALSGMLADPNCTGTAARTADAAYQFADAMLVAREVGQ